MSCYRVFASYYSSHSLYLNMSRIPGREDKLCVFRLYKLFKMYWSTVAGRMKYFRGSHLRNLYEHGMYIFISFSCGLVVISPRADWRHTPGHSGLLTLRPNGPLTLRPNGPLYGQTAGELECSSLKHLRQLPTTVVSSWSTAIPVQSEKLFHSVKRFKCRLNKGKRKDCSCNCA